MCLFLRAVGVHFGPSVDAGHYRTLLYPSMLCTNDGVGALKVFDAQLQEVQASYSIMRDRSCFFLKQVGSPARGAQGEVTPRVPRRQIPG